MEKQLEKIDYWAIVVFSFKLDWTNVKIGDFLKISPKTVERVLMQYNEKNDPVKNPGRKIGHGFAKELPPLSDRKSKEAINTVCKTATVALAKTGHSSEEIQKVANVSKNEITKILKEFKISQNLRSTKWTKSNKNDILANPKWVDSICDFIETKNLNNLLVTVKMIKVFFLDNLNKKLSKESVRKLLHQLGFIPMKPKIIPKLTEKHKENRKNYAEKEITKSWDNAIFTDESSIELFRFTKKTWVSSIEPPQIFQPANQKLSIMIWGGISKKGKTKLYFVSKDSKINQENYKKILENCLLDFGKTIHNNNFDFQQDNAPSHSALSIQNYLNEIVQGRILEHQAKSPDLNPIEHIWSILKSKVEDYQPKDFFFFLNLKREGKVKIKLN